MTKTESVSTVESHDELVIVANVVVADGFAVFQPDATVEESLETRLDTFKLVELGLNAVDRVLRIDFNSPLLALQCVYDRLHYIYS